MVSKWSAVNVSLSLNCSITDLVKPGGDGVAPPGCVVDVVKVFVWLNEKFVTVVSVKL